MTFMEWLKTEEGRMVSFGTMRQAVEIAYNAGQRDAIAAAVAAEREACAVIADEYELKFHEKMIKEKSDKPDLRAYRIAQQDTSSIVAAAIRARGEGGSHA